MIGTNTLNGILRDTIFRLFFLCSCCGPIMILATSMIHFHSAGWYCVELPCYQYMVRSYHYTGFVWGPDPCKSCDHWVDLRKQFVDRKPLSTIQYGIVNFVNFACKHFWQNKHVGTEHGQTTWFLISTNAYITVYIYILPPGALAHIQCLLWINSLIL
jgi:hypothetical protein